MSKKKSVRRRQAARRARAECDQATKKQARDTDRMRRERRAADDVLRRRKRRGRTPPRKLLGALFDGTLSDDGHRVTWEGVWPDIQAALTRDAGRRDVG